MKAPDPAHEKRQHGVTDEPGEGPHHAQELQPGGSDFLFGHHVGAHVEDDRQAKPERSPNQEAALAGCWRGVPRACPSGIAGSADVGPS